MKKIINKPMFDNSVKKISNIIGNKVGRVVKKSSDTISDSIQPVFESMDLNGNGEIDAEDIVLLAFKVPGVKVDRKKFLKSELKNNFSWWKIRKAIKKNPKAAKMDPDKIDEIADSVIQSERIKVSALSLALGVPGGAICIATSAVDIAQYYGYMLVAAQKLLYLYGFPQIEYIESEQTFDSETMNEIVICLGVMYGIAGANQAIHTISKAIGKGVEKQLLKKALTKGTIYPIVKSISKWFGVNMTKQVFAGFFKNSIPVVGGIVGGGLTYVTFKPCCMRLKETLQNTYLSNPDYKEENDELLDLD